MRYLIPSLAAGALLASNTAASADVGDELALLLPVEAMESGLYGQSVAIKGSIAIVGSPGDDENNDSGSAFVFDSRTGQLLGKLLPEDGEHNDRFGVSVAIDGPTGHELAIVGAKWDDDNEPNSGSAYVFDATTGRRIVKLLAEDGAQNDWFGSSVAISGEPGHEIAVVGAYGDDDSGWFSGSAYLFDARTGRQLAKIVPGDNAEGDRFGRSVAIAGATIVIGASHDDDHGDASGSAYVFDISDPANPVQTAKLVADDGATLAEFGYAVDISGPPGKGIAIVGSPWQSRDHPRLSWYTGMFRC